MAKHLSRLLFHECVNVNNGQVSPRESFLDYSIDIDRIFFDTWDKIFGDMEKYSAMCSWMNDIYG
jgi:hypothetical protein